MEILHFLRQGKSSAEMAAALRLTTSTITFHRARLRRLLGLTTEWELTRFAIPAPLEPVRGGKGRGRR